MIAVGGYNEVVVRAGDGKSRSTFVNGGKIAGFNATLNKYSYIMHEFFRQATR